MHTVLKIILLEFPVIKPSQFCLQCRSETYVSFISLPTYKVNVLMVNTKALSESIYVCRITYSSMLLLHPHNALYTTCYFYASMTIYIPPSSYLLILSGNGEILYLIGVFATEIIFICMFIFEHCKLIRHRITI